MNDIEFNGKNSRPLCFKHAVLAVVEDGEDVQAAALDAPDLNDWTGYLGQTCVVCYPPNNYDTDDEE